MLPVFCPFILALLSAVQSEFDLELIQDPQWGTPDNSVPRDTPRCGFRNELCQRQSGTCSCCTFLPALLQWYIISFEARAFTCTYSTLFAKRHYCRSQDALLISNARIERGVTASISSHGFLCALKLAQDTRRKKKTLLDDR